MINRGAIVQTCRLPSIMHKTVTTTLLDRTAAKRKFPDALFFINCNNCTLVHKIGQGNGLRRLSVCAHKCYKVSRLDIFCSNRINCRRPLFRTMSGLSFYCRGVVHNFTRTRIFYDWPESYRETPWKRFGCYSHVNTSL